MLQAADLPEQPPHEADQLLEKRLEERDDAGDEAADARGRLGGLFGEVLELGAEAAQVEVQFAEADHHIGHVAQLFLAQGERSEERRVG